MEVNLSDKGSETWTLVFGFETTSANANKVRDTWLISTRRREDANNVEKNETHKNQSMLCLPRGNKEHLAVFKKSLLYKIYFYKCFLTATTKCV